MSLMSKDLKYTSPTLTLSLGCRRTVQLLSQREFILRHSSDCSEFLVFIVHLLLEVPISSTSPPHTVSISLLIWYGFSILRWVSPKSSSRCRLKGVDMNTLMWPSGWVRVLKEGKWLLGGSGGSGGSLSGGSSISSLHGKLLLNQVLKRHLRIEVLVRQLKLGKKQYIRV